MSISDRLDQIEQWAARAASLSTEDWTTPECMFLVENELPELVEAVRRRDAALRAVLDLCDSTPEPYMPVRQADIRDAIAATLGEGTL